MFYFPNRSTWCDIQFVCSSFLEGGRIGKQSLSSCPPINNWGIWCQNKVIASHNILRDAITYPAWDICFWHQNPRFSVSKNILRFVASASYCTYKNHQHNYIVFGIWWLIVDSNWWFWCQKQVSQERKSNHIPQNTMGCNYLSLSEIAAYGTKVDPKLSIYFHELSWCNRLNGVLT